MEAASEGAVVSAPAAVSPVVIPVPVSAPGIVVSSTTPEVAEVKPVPSERDDVSDPARADESMLTSAVLWTMVVLS
jgi:hypothetical protein